MDLLADRIEEERGLMLLSALDECRAKGVSLQSMKVLVYETGASSLLTDRERKEYGRQAERSGNDSWAGV